MSESIIDDDPDPSPESKPETYSNVFGSGSNSREYDSELSAYYRELEISEAERHDVRVLSVRANALLSEHPGTVGEYDDQRLRVEDASLHCVRKNNSTVFYFIIGQEGEGRYCRSWAETGQQVNWCQQEKLHEPALEVLDRLNQVFAVPEHDEATRRRFARHIFRKSTKSQ